MLASRLSARRSTVAIRVDTIAFEIISCRRFYFVLAHLQGLTHSGRRVSADSERYTFAIRSRDRHQRGTGHWTSIRGVYVRRIVQTEVLFIHR